MARVRSRDTQPELALRSLLSRCGLRYRLHRKDLPGKPDIYIGRLRLAIFVNGCFWHGHDCPRAKLPSSNAAFWQEKIGRNRERDARSIRELGSRGIDALTLWQCTMRDWEGAARRLTAEYQKGAR